MSNRGGWRIGQGMQEAQASLDYLRQHLDVFPESLPALNLAAYFPDPHSRREWLYVGPPGCGKTTWLREIGAKYPEIKTWDVDAEVSTWDPTASNADKMAEVSERIHAIHMEHTRAVSDPMAQGACRWVVVMRDRYWEMLRRRTRIHAKRIESVDLSFSTTMFFAALRKIPVDHAHLFKVFPKFFFESLSDAKKRLVAPLAYAVMRATLHSDVARVGPAKSAALRECTRDWLVRQVDLAPWLVWCMGGADALRYRDYLHTSKAAKIKLRLSRSRALGGAPPFGLTIKQFITYCVNGGVWRYIPNSKELYWGYVYTASASALKIHADHRLLLTRPSLVYAPDGTPTIRKRTFTTEFPE